MCEENFSKYHELVAANEIEALLSTHFDLYRNLLIENGKKGDNILFQFLNQVYDTEEGKIMSSLPSYLADLALTKILDSKSFSQAISQLLLQLPDFSLIASSLASVIYRLVECKVLNLRDIVWVNDKAEEDDEDMVFVEPFYKIIAHLIQLVH